MIQTWKTGSTISCLWPHRADHAGVPVMLPRKSDSDMCRDGASTAKLRSQHPVDEPGRVHGVSDLDHIADAQRLSSNKGRLLAMKERWRWRKLRKSRSQIRGQDKGRQCAKPMRPGRGLDSQGFRALLRNVCGNPALCGAGRTPAAVRVFRTLRPVAA